MRGSRPGSVVSTRACPKRPPYEICRETRLLIVAAIAPGLADATRQSHDNQHEIPIEVSLVCEREPPAGAMPQMTLSATYLGAM